MKHYSTECECGNWIHWSEGEQIPKCSRCGKVGHFRHPPFISVTASHNALVRIMEPEPDTKSLRKWWHEILRHYDHYPFYAMLLALPSDNEAVRYLKDYGKELHFITDNNCLVITLTGLGFMQYGSDDKVAPRAVDDHIAEGHCLQVAKLFKVRYDEFPCLLLFRDIRKPEHIKISLKGLNAEDIAQKMRELFSVVDDAIRQGKDPLESVDRYNRKQAVSEKTNAIASGIQSFAGKTLETIMEAFVKASIK